ncbi:MAG: nitroreductase family protein [Ilumatobacteraceae bacterium]
MIPLLTGLATTRTIRRYTAEPIPEADLSSILWHASRAPSGSNRQGVRYLVLLDGPTALQARRILGESFRSSWAAKRADDGYSVGSAVDASSPKGRMAATMQHFVDHLEDVPAIVLVCLRRHRAPNPYEGASVYPAVQNLLLAARALGYGGALTMWHQVVEAELREMLGVPHDVAISACVTLGRPKGAHGPVRRRPLHDVVFADRWGERAAWAVDPPGTQHAGGPGHQDS